MASTFVEGGKFRIEGGNRVSAYTREALNACAKHLVPRKLGLDPSSKEFYPVAGGCRLTIGAPNHVSEPFEGDLAHPSGRSQAFPAS